MANYYFSFGSSDRFPFQGGYLIVKANNKKEALEKYREKYPDRNPNCINCSFYYTEEQWNHIKVDMGKCHEIIL